MKKLNPLFRLAAISGVEAAISFHIRRGDDLNARDTNGATPLILAAARKNKGAIKLLIDAGANPTLVDPKGMDALAYALRTNCSEAVEMLTAALKMNSADVIATAKSVVENPEPSIDNVEGSSPNQAELLVKKGVVQTCSVLPQISKTDALLLDDTPLGTVFESEWVAEEDVETPVGDKSVVEMVKNIHKVIGQHKVLDSDEDWGDIDLYLPERSAFWDSGEVEEVFRPILLTAIREKIVSERMIIGACLNNDESRNEEAERFLGFVVGEFGAVVTESKGFDVTGAFLDDLSLDDLSLDELSLEEKFLLDNAIEFVRDLASGYNEPFRFYSKNLRGKLLEAEEELTLGREMEEAMHDALAALARWPEGLALLFDVSDKVALGEADAESFCGGFELLLDDESTDQADINDEEGKRSNEVSGFVSAIAVVRDAIGDFNLTEEALAAANLSRGFLVGLARQAKGNPAVKGFINALERQSFARERMIQCNLRLALSIAKKYQWSELPLDDLVQEANIGLIKAVERYDWRKGFRFSTYATWWIRQQVTRAIANTAKAVRAPVHIQELARRIIREREEAEILLGRSEPEIESAKRNGMPLSKMWMILSMFDDVESLDEIDSDTGHSRADLLVDWDAPLSSTLVEHASLCSTISRMLDELDARSRDVIVYRFGLEAKEEMTLEQIGQCSGVTRERIRQIESKAMEKLSIDKRKDILAPFMIEDRYQ
jgi:RNA polymerase primary sigma factor